MNARAVRPQSVPEPGQRVVLVIPRSGEHTRALTAALDEITRLGWELVGVVDPRDHLDALRLVVDGAADVVLATNPDHMPALRFAWQLDGMGSTMPVIRSGTVPSGTVARSRTQLVDRQRRPGPVT